MISELKELGITQLCYGCKECPPMRLRGKVGLRSGGMKAALPLRQGRYVRLSPQEAFAVVALLETGVQAEGRAVDTMCRALAGLAAS